MRGIFLYYFRSLFPPKGKKTPEAAYRKALTASFIWGIFSLVIGLVLPFAAAYVFSLPKRTDPLSDLSSRLLFVTATVAAFYLGAFMILIALTDRLALNRMKESSASLAATGLHSPASEEAWIRKAEARHDKKNSQLFFLSFNTFFGPYVIIEFYLVSRDMLADIAAGKTSKMLNLIILTGGILFMVFYLAKELPRHIRLTREILRDARTQFRLAREYKTSR